GATHVLNPDKFIIETNIALMERGREFDAGYNASLSDDALPILVSSINEMKLDDQKKISCRLAKRYCEKREENDLRDWNISRSASSSILEAKHVFIEALGECDTNRFCCDWGRQEED